jgi:hypothetical protein
MYLLGTYINTPEGERRIEDLKIGDPIIVLSGKRKPIKWIGRLRFENNSECLAEGAGPIRIRRFALDARTPHRDLYLTPNHRIYIDGMLIPAKYFVNGLSITPAAPEGAEVIDCFHIELFDHDILYAEGAMIETFRTWPGSHKNFDNLAEYCRLYPNEDETAPPACAPIFWGYSRLEKALRPLRRVLVPWIDTRTTVDKLRDRLAARARHLIE